jgi:hypothetical protein
MESELDVTRIREFTDGDQERIIDLFNQLGYSTKPDQLEKQITNLVSPEKCLLRKKLGRSAHACPRREEEPIGLLPVESYQT